MLRTTTRAALAAVVFTTVAAGPALAQAASPIRFNIHAGAAVPTGDFADGAKTGFTIGGGLSLRPASLPFGLRFDGGYNKFQNEFDDDLSADIWSITADAEFAPALSPLYFLAGVGAYSHKVNVSGVGSSDSETDFGFNVGGGFKLPLTGFNTFLEARYHSFTVDDVRQSYIPIVFGVSF